jgi:LCP family protein required for cell wall assembly
MRLGRGSAGGATHESGGLPARPQRRRYSVRAKLLGSFAILVAIVLVGASLDAYLTYRRDWNGVSHIDVSKDLHGRHLPPPDPNALNILLIGSDSRAGPNEKFGATIQGQRSDTIMVLHIAPDAHQVIVLSIPRDSVVPILSCSAEPGAAGQTAEPRPNVEQINATFAYGGPGCLWKTIEETTGIHLNDFVELTFTGFEHVISDLGGVNICLPVAVHDRLSGLNLTAGMHHVGGSEALAFWRVRYIGEGSDLERIQRDQFLMASLLQGIERSGLMHDPLKLLSVINDVTSHGYIATDTGLTAGRLYTIAEELRGVSPSLVQFVQVPTEPYPGNPLAWVQWPQPEAGQLFAAIAHDTSVLKLSGHEQDSANGAASLDSISPSKVNVTVLNGSGVAGVAASTAASLIARGFHLAGPPSDAASMSYTSSVVEYAGTADLPAARTLAAQLSDVRLEQDPSVPPGTVELIIGSSFSGLKPLTTTSHGATTGTGKTGTGKTATGKTATSQSPATLNLTPKYGGIKGNAAICSDARAFAGPDGDH